MNRIFGNRGSPEDATDQIFANLALFGRIFLGHELVIRRTSRARTAGMVTLWRTQAAFLLVAGLRRVWIHQLWLMYTTVVHF